MSPPPPASNLRIMLVQLRAVIVKEILQTIQDRRILMILTVAPFVQLLVFGYAIDLGVDQVPTVIVDQDGTPESRRLLQGMQADGTLRAVDVVPDNAAAERQLETGEAAVAVIVPKGLSRDLTRGDPVAVQVLLDGSDPTRSGVAGAAAGQYFGGEGLRLTRERLQRLSDGRLKVPSVDVRPRLLFNPTLSTAIYMVPGIAGMLLLIITTIITSMGLAREREIGTLEQVRVTPLPTPILMLGKIAPFVTVGLFDVTAAITAGAWIFDVPIRGSLIAFYVVTFAYLLTTVGAGLFISTVSETQQQAFIGGFMFILPAMLLSGTMSPIHAMPEWMQPLTLLNPLRYYMEAIRAILLKGTPLSDLMPQFLALMGFGVAIMTAASLRFQKRVA
jgi:ABC-2 type transport system permease protein